MGHDGGDVGEVGVWGYCNKALGLSKGSKDQVWNGSNYLGDELNDMGLGWYYSRALEWGHVGWCKSSSLEPLLNNVCKV